MDKALRLSPAQRLKLFELEALERVKSERAFRQHGRLFVGEAPTSECAEERRKLFRDWDAIIQHYGAKNPPHLLRYLRGAYERPEVDKGSREMRFIREVEELREFESQEWDTLKDKGGKRAGQWISQSRKRRRR
jgi:hypothetical protein